MTQKRTKNPDIFILKSIKFHFWIRKKSIYRRFETFFLIFQQINFHNAPISDVDWFKSKLDIQKSKNF